MATLSDLQTYIAARLIDPNNQVVTVAQITQAVNDSIRYWKYRRFWFNEVNDTATLTQGNSSFPYPTNFLVPSMKDDGFCIEFGGVRYPLSKVSNQVYDALYISNNQGLPTWYARTGDTQYQCYPIPQQNYTVRRHYLKNYTALSASGDNNDFTNNAERLIELWSLAQLNAELRQDTEMSSYYEGKANDEYRQLNLMTTKSNATGKLQISSELMGVF